MESPLSKIYPEMHAGGFTRRDGTVQFYTRLNALLRPDFTVLDLGAGRAAWQESPVALHRTLQNLQGRVARLVGADVDPVVLHNTTVDKAIVLQQGGILPFDDGEFDLVFSDHTLEHVDQVDLFTLEIRRVLRDGGWFCARTPYRWGSTGVATNLVPNTMHVRLLRWLQPARSEQDMFPTQYNLNSKRRIARAFPGWVNASYLHTPEPAYFGFASWALRVGQALDFVLPGNVLHVFVQKPAVRGSATEDLVLADNSLDQARS